MLDFNNSVLRIFILNFWSQILELQMICKSSKCHLLQSANYSLSLSPLKRRFSLVASEKLDKTVNPTTTSRGTVRNSIIRQQSSLSVWVENAVPQKGAPTKNLEPLSGPPHKIWSGLKTKSIAPKERFALKREFVFRSPPKSFKVLLWSSFKFFGVPKVKGADLFR